MDRQNDQLGKLIKESDLPQRDAIHVAIAPVTAGKKLWPGDEPGVYNTSFATETDHLVRGVLAHDDHLYVMHQYIGVRIYDLF